MAKFIRKMHLDELFQIKNIESHSVQIELSHEFKFPSPKFVWIQIGIKSIGQPPQPDGFNSSNNNAVSSKTPAATSGTASGNHSTASGDNKNASASIEDDDQIVWKRFGDKLTPERRRIRVKHLQPNYCYFVKIEGDDFNDDVKSFWTNDWQDSDKVLASIDNNCEVGQFYTLGRRLGRGHFGDVNLCAEKELAVTTSAEQSVSFQYVYAVKIMKTPRRQQIESGQNEIAILRELRHENIVWLKQAIWAPKSMLYLVMEYIPGGELFDKISSDNYLLTELDCSLYLLQICQALAYVHTKSIVHLDLKVENIMLACPERRQIKIVDFGIARKLTPGVPCKVMCGTAEFCAPEVLTFDPVSTQTDMWSVGVIAYIMLSGLSPFLGDNDNETHANVVAGEYTFDDPAFDPISDPAKEFISQLIVKPKEHRLSAEKAATHEWLLVAHKTLDALKAVPISAPASLEDLEGLGDEELDAAISFGRRISITAINTTKLRAYWARRKWKKACGVLRAVQRITLNWAQQRSTASSGVSSFESSATPPNGSVSEGGTPVSSCPPSKDASPMKQENQTSAEIP